MRKALTPILIEYVETYHAGGLSVKRWKVIRVFGIPVYRRGVWR